MFKLPLSVQRSGNGAHLWIFFSSPVPATTARQMGSFILTQANGNNALNLVSIRMTAFFRIRTRCQKAALEAYRSALQKSPRENGNSVFVDEDFNPIRTSGLSFQPFAPCN